MVNWEYDFLEKLRVYDGKIPDDLVKYVRDLLDQKERDLLQKLKKEIEGWNSFPSPSFGSANGSMFQSAVINYLEKLLSQSNQKGSKE